MMDLNRFFNDPTKDCSFKCSIPSLTKREPCLLGIDEAGRGPVLGPMVYASAYFPICKSDELSQMAFADSKTLTEEKREDLFSKIGDDNELGLGWFATVLSPVTISNSMFMRSKYNLNALSHDTAIALIKRAIESGVNVKQVFVDTVGPADKYESKLKGIFPHLKIKVANKADSTYPIVSAASVCAKVIRDRIVKSWKFIENIHGLSELNYGSGYPSDPVTKKFLTEAFDPIFGFPTFVRFSWSTVTKILDEKAVECEWEKDESDDDDSAGNTSITDFFKRKSDAQNEGSKLKKKQKTIAFFADRNLKPVTSLSSL